MKRHPAIAYLEKDHQRFFDAEDQVHWGCTCGAENGCEIRDMLDMQAKARNAYNAIRGEYLKVIDDYQAKMMKAMAEAHALEVELEKIAKRSVTPITFSKKHPLR